METPPTTVETHYSTNNNSLYRIASEVILSHPFALYFFPFFFVIFITQLYIAEIILCDDVTDFFRLLLLYCPSLHLQTKPHSNIHLILFIIMFMFTIPSRFSPLKNLRRRRFCVSEPAVKQLHSYSPSHFFFKNFTFMETATQPISQLHSKSLPN